MLVLPDSRRDDREDGRRGVVGREAGLRVPVPLAGAFVLLLARGVVEEDIVLRGSTGADPEQLLYGIAYIRRRSGNYSLRGR